MARIIRSESDIDDMLNKAIEQAGAGGKWPGQTYEQGVVDCYDWLTGHTDENPMED